MERSVTVGARATPVRSIAGRLRRAGSIATLMIVAGGLLALTPARAASAASISEDSLEKTVRHVAGGETTTDADLHRVWSPLMQASAVERMRAYEAPASVAGYLGGEVPDSPCAVATNARYWRQNARYCSLDATILYDKDWLRELEATFGAFAPAAVLAHEWGHHVQAFADPVQPGLRAELQADCFAGMYLGETEGIEPDGSYTMRLDELRSSLTWFFEHGDANYRQSQWFQPGLHGSRQQRIIAFITGYIAKSTDRGEIRRQVNGLDWCLGYADFEPGSYVDIGPYRLLAIPGRPGIWTDEDHVISTRRHPAVPSSEIRLRWFPASEPIDQATNEGLAERMATWAPGASVTPLGALALRTGSGVASTFETTGEVGIVALAVPVTGDGGLLILVSRPRGDRVDVDMAGDLAVFLEQAIAINEVTNRLCSPGESPDPTDPAHNAVCMADAQ